MTIVLCIICFLAGGVASAWILALSAMVSHTQADQS